MSSQKFGTQTLKGFRTFRVSSGTTSEAIEEFLQSLDCPRSLAILILFRNGEYKQIADFEFNPDLYLTVEACRDAYAATMFLSKYKGLTLGSDLDKAAMQKFDGFELLCKQTNSRFRDLSRDPKFKGRVVWLHNAVIRKIERILGDCSADDFFSMPDWGPGATTLIKRRDASSVKKFQCETGITRDLYDLVPLSFLQGVYPLWANQLMLAGYPTFQTGNKVITVPKDAKANRVIAIEPGINLWFQKSIGNMVRRRLQRFGVDLRWQSKNQELARVGSLTNALATIDLSSASDSIASSVVEALLPPRWLMLMDASRSHYGTQGTLTKKWEKFSSMGNGFTFELESLIFYAVALSCAEYLHISSSDVSAYGDDVVIPSVCFEIFSEMLDFYGFRINRNKSFVSSNFRESCGAHFFSGEDVKPVYLKDKLSSVLSLYRLANAIRRLAHRRGGTLYCDASLRKVFDRLVQRCPKALRLRIPETLGDGGFIANFDEATPSRARHGIEGYRVANAVESGITRFDDTEGYLIASLWSLPERPEGDNPSSRFPAAHPTHIAGVIRLWGDHPRLKATAFLSVSKPSLVYNSVPVSGQTQIRIARSLVSQWYDLGLWL